MERWRIIIRRTLREQMNRWFESATRTCALCFWFCISFQHNNIALYSVSRLIHISLTWPFQTFNLNREPEKQPRNESSVNLAILISFSLAPSLPLSLSLHVLIRRNVFKNVYFVNVLSPSLRRFCRGKEVICSTFIAVSEILRVLAITYIKISKCVHAWMCVLKPGPNSYNFVSHRNKIEWIHYRREK